MLILEILYSKEPMYLKNWTKKQLLEYSKCMEDPLFFIQNYVKIVSLDEGLVSFQNVRLPKRNGWNIS